MGLSITYTPDKDYFVGGFVFNSRWLAAWNRKSVV